MVSFAVHKLLNLTSPICLFLFLFPSLEDIGLKKHFYEVCQRVFCLFFSRSFIVSGLTFRFLIQVYFVHGVREWYNFILLPVAVLFSQHHLLKILSFEGKIGLHSWHHKLDRLSFHLRHDGEKHSRIATLKTVSLASMESLILTFLHQDLGIHKLRKMLIMRIPYQHFTPFLHPLTTLKIVLL